MTWSDPGVAADQLRRLGGSRGLRSGPSRRTFRRGLVRRVPPATDRCLAQRGDTECRTSGRGSLVEKALPTFITSQDVRAGGIMPVIGNGGGYGWNRVAHV